jgi:carbonic anhydrase
LFDLHRKRNRHAVFIVGHTDCGGAKASYKAAHGNTPILGPLGQWLEPLVALSRELGSTVTPDELAVRNVQEQFSKLVGSKAFREARRKGERVR